MPIVIGNDLAIFGVRLLSRVLTEVYKNGSETCHYRRSFLCISTGLPGTSPKPAASARNERVRYPTQ
jgi:hypothetical protein